MSGNAFRRPRRSWRLGEATKIRVEGAKELIVTAARKSPVVDNVLIAKEVFDSTYKVIKGKEPPSLRSESKNLPPGIARFEKESAKRERRFDRRFR